MWGLILNRVDALKQLAFEQNTYDGYVVFGGANLLYFAGFPGASALLIPKEGESTLYAYNVNYELAKAKGKDFNVELVSLNENLMVKIAKQAKDFKIRKLALDSLNIDEWRALCKETKGTTKLKQTNQFVRELRRVKEQNEIELMRKAGELTSEGMKVAYEIIKPGMKEIEVAAEIEYAMRKRGSSGTAFDTSVASGPNSAFPHGGCSERKIRKGEIVIVDMGAAYKFYCSDMTRTIVAGKPTEKQKKIHSIVLEAQQNALKLIKTGTAALIHCPVTTVIIFR